MDILKPLFNIILVSRVTSRKKYRFFSISKRTYCWSALRWIFLDSKVCQIINLTDRWFEQLHFSARYFKYLRRDMRALILILNADPFATIRLPAAPGVRRQGHAIACTADAPPRVQTLDVHASRGIQRGPEKGERERERKKTWGCSTRGRQPHMDFNSWPRGSLIKYVRNIVRRPHSLYPVKQKYVTNSLLPRTN